MADTTGDGIGAPAVDGYVVTPSDGADLTFVTRGVYVSVEGTLQVTLASGSVVAIPVAVVGYHPIRVKRVWSTNTDATGIIAYR